MDIMKFLRNIPEWNELLKLPAKVAELEKRLEALERPDNSFDICPKCKKRTFQLISSKPDPVMSEIGAVVRLYRCNYCNFEEAKQLIP